MIVLTTREIFAALRNRYKRAVTKALPWRTTEERNRASGSAITVEACFKCSEKHQSYYVSFVKEPQEHHPLRNLVW